MMCNPWWVDLLIYLAFSVVAAGIAYSVGYSDGRAQR